MSDSYLWVYFFSAQLMTMMNPVLCSKLMELDMENFVYMNLTTTELGSLTLPIVKYVYEKWLNCNTKLLIFLNQNFMT